MSKGGRDWRARAPPSRPPRSLPPCALRSKLRAALAPAVLTITNESHLHAGHAGDPGTGESHFRVSIVSAAFEGASAVARHRLVYAALGDEIRAGLHALSLKTRTPGEAGRGGGGAV